MNDFFKQRNATELPYVEVYVGPTKVDALVMYPERNFRAPLESEALRVPPDLLRGWLCHTPALTQERLYQTQPACLPATVAGLQTSLAAAQRLRREAQWQSTSAKWLRERDALYARLGRARERLAAERGARAERPDARTRRPSAFSSLTTRRPPPPPRSRSPTRRAPTPTPRSSGWRAPQKW